MHKNVAKNILQNEGNNDLNISISLNGKLIPEKEIGIQLISITNSNDPPQTDTIYDIQYAHYSFRIRRNYLNQNGHENHIQYDNRIIGNRNRKKLPNESLWFIRKYFILDTGTDDIHLIPIAKNRE